LSISLTLIYLFFSTTNSIIINNGISIAVIIDIVLFVTTIRICTWLYIIHICDNSVYNSIWYWTIYRNYKKFFIKNFNILKIFHSKFTEKITFGKLMFQSRIVIFFITTIRTPFWTVFFNHIGNFGNTNFEFISTSGMKYSSEANAKFRILKVEL